MPAFLTLERLTLTIVWVSESTVRTPTRRVLWVYLLYAYAVLGGFVFDVFDVFVQAVERPLVPPRRASSVTNIGQVLERDYRTLVVTSFCHEFVRYSMECYLEPGFFFATDCLYILVCPSCAVFL